MTNVKLANLRCDFDSSLSDWNCMIHR
jgi:hypothetical protein